MLPWAKALMATRDETQEPHNACLPMGVPRVTPFPYRFVQNYTHKPATHMFILHEGNIHTYRQIFMDGRKHPAELDSTLARAFDRPLGEGHAASSTPSATTTSSGSTAAAIRIPSSCTQSSGGPG